HKLHLRPVGRGTSLSEDGSFDDAEVCGESCERHCQDQDCERAGATHVLPSGAGMERGAGRTTVRWHLLTIRSPSAERRGQLWSETNQVERGNARRIAGTHGGASQGETERVAARGARSRRAQPRGGSRFASPVGMRVRLEEAREDDAGGMRM